MAKVNFNKLSRGQPLTPGMIWDNLDQAATALSGNISSDQRSQSRSSFSVALHRVRFSDAVWDSYTSGIGTERPNDFTFQLPPLQEFFSSSLVSSASTPDIILESLVVSFDTMNQEKPILLWTGQPDTGGGEYNRSLEVTIESGNNIAKTAIPISTLNLKNDVITNKPNPAVSAYIGASIGAYSPLKITITPPVKIDYPATNPFSNDSPSGVDNMVVHATFSAPVVQRDHAAHTVLPQNAPLHDCARSPANNILTRPAAGTSINAVSGTYGVQDAFSQLDRQVRDRLSGGLTRWSEVRGGTEALLEDQGYFCWMVPLFNVPEDEGLADHASLTLSRSYNTLDGYLRYSSDYNVRALMDKAVLPIVAPGTIHHVGVFWDRIYMDLPPPGAPIQVVMDFGAALGCKSKAETSEYTQITQTVQKDVTFNAATNYIRNFYSPIAYSTAVGAPALGKGYVQQGRPFFFGREIDYTSGVRRRDVASASNPALAEAAPSTNGTENFLELRCNMYAQDTATGVKADIDVMTAGNSYFGNGSGVMVCIYGKMALVD